MNVLKTKTSAIEYVASRIRNLAAQVATRMEDDGVPRIASELIELAVVLNLVALILARDDVVVIQGDDYNPTEEGAGLDDIPF